MISLKQFLTEEKEILTQQVRKNPYFYILLQHFNLNQSVKLAKQIEKALKQFDLQNIESDQIQQLQLSDKGNKMIKVIKKNNKVQDVKIGKILQKLIPSLATDKNKANKIFSKITAYIKKQNQLNYFEQYNEVTKWYSLVYEKGKTSSCMTGSHSLTKVYDNQKNISILIRYVNGIPKYRALVWRNIQSDSGKKGFVDRIYPADDQMIIGLFQTWAQDNNFNYRMGMKLKQYNTLRYGRQMTYYFEDEYYAMPYLDTFRYYSEEYNAVTTNYYKFEDNITCDNQGGTNTDGSNSQERGNDDEESYTSAYDQFDDLNYEEQSRMWNNYYKNRGLQTTKSLIMSNTNEGIKKMIDTYYNGSLYDLCINTENYSDNDQYIIYYNYRLYSFTGVQQLYDGIFRQDFQNSDFISNYVPYNMP